METSLEAITIIEDSDVLGYKAYLSQINNDNPYYKYELINVDFEYNYHLMYFLYKINGEPLILMPFYLKPIMLDNDKSGYYDVSSPWGYTGPLFKSTLDDMAIKNFWHAIGDWYKKNNVISEFIRFNFTGNHNHYNGIVQHALTNVKGKITDLNNLWKNFDRSVRKNFNTASNSDLTYNIYHKSFTNKQIEEFYDIYIGTMDRHSANANFYHSKNYFSKFIFNNLNNCAICTVYKDNVAISTELVLLSKDYIYSFLGGTNSQYFHLRPNDFLKIKMLNWAQENGFSYYIIGGGRKDGDSLYKYKKKFFPKDADINFYTGRKILDREIYNGLSYAHFEKNSMKFSEADMDKEFFPAYRKPFLMTKVG